MPLSCAAKVTRKIAGRQASPHEARSATTATWLRTALAGALTSRGRAGWPTLARALSDALRMRVVPV